MEWCPWHAFSLDIVQRVNRAMPFFESGQLAFREPNPSHRLVEAIAFYSMIDNRIRGKQFDLESESRRKASESSALELKRRAR